MCSIFQILTSHLKSFRLLDSIRIIRQFHPQNQSTTRRPSHLRYHHFNRNGLFPALQTRSLVFNQTSITLMDSSRITNRNNITIPPTTGTTGNTLLLSIQLLWQIKHFTPTLFLTRILLFTVIIHLKQQISFIISHVCKFHIWRMIDNRINNQTYLKKLLSCFKRLVN